MLLLDDVFSELDPGRAEALLACLPGGQAVVTTAGELPPALPSRLGLASKTGSCSHDDMAAGAADRRGA